MVGDAKYYKVCNSYFPCGTPLSSEKGMDGLLKSDFKKAQELLKALRTNNSNVWYLEFSEANHDNLGAVAPDYLLAAWTLFLKTFVLN